MSVTKQQQQHCLFDAALTQDVDISIAVIVNVLKAVQYAKKAKVCEVMVSLRWLWSKKARADDLWSLFAGDFLLCKVCSTEM